MADKKEAVAAEAVPEERAALTATATEQPVVRKSDDGPGITAKTADELPYIVNQWQGMNHYECKAPGCGFDTLDPEAMKEHIALTHNPVPLRQAVGVPILDRFGNVITDREV